MIFTSRDVKNQNDCLLKKNYVKITTASPLLYHNLQKACIKQYYSIKL